MYPKVIFIFFISSMLLFAGCSGLSKTSVNDKIKMNYDSMQHNIDTIVAQIKQKHSINILYKKAPALSWLMFKYDLPKPSDYSQVLNFVSLIQSQLDKYPQGFLTDSGIKSMVICKNLSSYGHDADGFSDPRAKIIYYVYNNSVESKELIHHEIYHMLEAKFNGSLFYKDPNWAKLNSKYVSYGKGGRYYKSHVSGSYYHPAQGLVTSYAASALEEDKAEVFAFLLVDDLNPFLQRWISQDPILKNKVTYIKEFLACHCPQFSFDFWDAPSPASQNSSQK